MLLLRKIFNQYIIIFIGLGTLFFKISNLVSITDSQTWDGSGHKVLLNIFIQLSSQFLAEGYVDDWFGGFPAFRFYPSFFAFLGSLAFHLGLDLDTSFRVSIWMTVLVLIVGYYYLVRAFLKPVFAISALFLYLSFQGPPTLGTSFAGIWGGNFPSLLGTGLSFIAIGVLVRFNPNLNKINTTNHLFLLSTLCLLGYTHYLNFIFTYFVILIFSFVHTFHYILLNEKNALLRRNLLILVIVLLIPLIISIPSFYGPIFQSSESSGETLLVIYPFLENILGLNYSTEPFIDLIVNPAKTIPLILTFGVFYFKRKNENYTFLFLVYVLLFMISQDLSIPKIFLSSGIHFYRAWDIFLGIHFLIAIKGLSNFSKKINLEYTIFYLAIICLLFLGYKHKENRSNSIVYNQWLQESSKYSFDQNEFVLIEETTTFPWDVSPHKILPWLQDKKINTVNGLMVESSWTTYLNRLYIPVRNKNNFTWGYQDPYITFELNSNSKESSLQYLHQRNITKIISKTNDFRNNILDLVQEIPMHVSNINSKTLLESKIQINPVRSNLIKINRNNPKIIGLIQNESILHLKRINKPTNFFIKSFKLQNDNTEIVTYIDLDPAWNQERIHDLLIPLDKVIVYSTKDFQTIDELSYDDWNQFLKKQIHNTNSDFVDLQESKQICQTRIFNQSYFPDLYLKPKEIKKQIFQYFRTHFNQTLVCGNFKNKDNESNIKLQFSPLLGRIKFLLMILIFLSWVLSTFFLYKNTKA